MIRSVFSYFSSTIIVSLTLLVASTVYGNTPHDPIKGIEAKTFVVESQQQAINTINSLINDHSDEPTIVRLDEKYKKTKLGAAVKEAMGHGHPLFYSSKTGEKASTGLILKYTIIAIRTVTLSGFAFYSISITDQPIEVAYAYAGATFFLQYLFGQYNDLELRYIAHKLKFKLQNIINFKNPLSIDDSKESLRASQFSKWVLLEMLFLTGIESTKAINPEIDFNGLHILKDVFQVGLLTTFMQEPLDSLNSIYTQRKIQAAKKRYVTEARVNLMKNLGNIRTTTISLYSTILSLLVLNPESFADKVPVEISTYMLVTGAVFHAVNIAYKSQWLTKTVPKANTCSMLFNPIKI